MINAFFGLFGVALILLTSEILWKLKIMKRAETPRKFVHILTGVFIAFWPLFIEMIWIQAICILLFVAVYTSKKFKLFQSIHSVKRLTYGEILFPLGVFVAASFSSSGWTYMAAVLHLSVADGLAALIGSRFNKRYGYKIFGHQKTIIGTFVFYVSSMCIIGLTMYFDKAAYGPNVPYVLLVLPLITASIENIGAFGTDNILVPLVVVFVLNTLRTPVPII